ncbi:MAG TPA: hypoxanthine phosphoribosyltransferase [Planctomycetota bacterium]|nr:hypoxanthine phosphoribosyltransferase [Planctomycetota bacterium]
MKLTPIISEEQVRQRVAELASQIRSNYAGRELTIIGAMKGSLFFLVDLIRNLDRPVCVDLISVSSYRWTATTGKPEIQMPVTIDLRGRHVLIVDDVLDTGLTLGNVLCHVRECGAESVSICVLLIKKVLRTVDIEADYCGFELDGEFVVGYGLDLDGAYRDLPYIAAVEPDQNRPG